MDHSDVEAVFYQRYSDLTGTTQVLQMGKRNGQRVPVLGPECTEVGESEDEAADTEELREELCYGLNETERRTWLKIINGQSVLDIARDEGIKRAAIYSRIRGSKRSQGMIHKNFYVARWWQLRQKGQLQS